MLCLYKEPFHPLQPFLLIHLALPSSASNLTIKQAQHLSHPSINQSINQTSTKNENLRHLHHPLPPRRQPQRGPHLHRPPIRSPAHIPRRPSRRRILHPVRPHRRLSLPHLYVIPRYLPTYHPSSDPYPPPPPLSHTTNRNHLVSPPVPKPTKKPSQELLTCI